METNKIIILDMLPTSTGKLHSSSRIVDGGASLLPSLREITKTQQEYW